MREFKNILVPIDFSEASLVLIPYAKYLIDKLGAKVHLLYVARSLSYMAGFYVPHPSIKRFEEEMLEGVKKSMEKFLDEHFQGIPVETHILTGDAASEIIKFSQENDIDLILMGTHGRKGLDKTIFGSVAECVVRGASCPVLTINPYRIKKIKS